MGGNQEGRVMVAIDESECSRYALQWTVDRLRDSIAAFSSPLLIFTVQPLADLSYIHAASYGSAPPELIQSMQEHQRKMAEDLLQKAKDVCSARGVAAETVAEIGVPKEAICAAVEKYKINLLVLGNHGRGAFKRAFLGSVSNYCVHNASCPVLVVKKPE